MPLAKITYDENQNHLESKVCHKHVKFINFKYYKIIHFLSNMKFAWEVTIIIIIVITTVNDVIVTILMMMAVIMIMIYYPQQYP